MTLRTGRRDNGFDFSISDERLRFHTSPPDIADILEGYDPRVVQLDGRYYVIWCNNYHRYTIKTPL